MIKIDKEKFEIETDCKTVGEFMTEAAAFGLSVKVSIDDGDEYFFESCQNVKVVDDTPIDKVLFDRADYTLNARASFRVITKPKPKTVRKSGWVNIYRAFYDKSKRIVGTIYDTKAEANELPRSAARISVAKIEWEEEVR